MSQNFSKLIKNGFSGRYISAQAGAGFSLLFQFKSVIFIFFLDFVSNLQLFIFTGL